MRPGELLELIRTRSFVPLRIYTTDGRSYDIRRPDQIIILRERVDIGVSGDGEIGDGDGRLQPCSHKAFRRYDIIISSVACGEWRGAMPARGTDGFERAALLASYLDPIDAWIEKGQEAHVESQRGDSFIALLGEPDDTARQGRNQIKFHAEHAEQQSRSQTSDQEMFNG